MTQLERMTSAVVSAIGRCSISPSRNSTLPAPTWRHFPRLAQHLVGHVYTDDPAFRADLARGEQTVEAGAAAQVHEYSPDSVRRSPADCRNPDRGWHLPAPRPVQPPSNPSPAPSNARAVTAGRCGCGPAAGRTCRRQSAVAARTSSLISALSMMVLLRQADLRVRWGSVAGFTNTAAAPATAAVSFLVWSVATQAPVHVAA